MAKMFEDAFRTLGVLEEDDPKYVAKSVLEVVVEPVRKGSKKSNDSRSKGNAEDKDWVEVTITPYVKDKP